MTNIQSLIEDIIRFRDERHWAQFHNSKDLAIALFRVAMRYLLQTVAKIVIFD